MGYWFANAFVHQHVKDLVHKNSKLCIYIFVWQSFNHHIQFWQVGNLANVILKKKLTDNRQKRLTDNQNDLPLIIAGNVKDRSSAVRRPDVNNCSLLM